MASSTIEALLARYGRLFHDYCEMLLEYEKLKEKSPESTDKFVGGPVDGGHSQKTAMQALIEEPSREYYQNLARSLQSENEGLRSKIRSLENVAFEIFDDLLKILKADMNK